MRNGSSRLIRDITIASPSIASSRPASVPSAVDANSRRPMRATISTARTPQTAAAIRHAAELPTPPPKWIPSAISHLPTCGCTTYEPTSVRPLVSPASNAGFGSSPHVASKPLTSSEYASLT